jgi:uncharacterized protein (TIGR00369 family)
MYDLIRSQLAEAVPFVKLLGIELLDLGDGFARARLVQRPDLSNHLATMHAGALFTLAETVSGAAMAGAFAEMIMGIRPVATEARIAYLKLARGIVTCTAGTAEEAGALRRRLREKGEVAFEVEVNLFREDEQRVAAMTIAWNVRLASPPAG